MSSGNPFESDFESQVDSTATKKKVASKSASASSKASTSKAKAKPKKPATLPTFNELFGSDLSDSEPETAAPKKKKRARVFPESDDEEEPVNVRTLRAAPLQSILSRRTGSKFTVQRDHTRVGDFYIECRLYNSADIDALSPEDFKSHWRRAFTTYKCAFNRNSATFKAASNLVAAAKEDLRNITPIEYPAQMF